MPEAVEGHAAVAADFVHPGVQQAVSEGHLLRLAHQAKLNAVSIQFAIAPKRGTRLGDEGGFDRCAAQEDEAADFLRLLPADSIADWALLCRVWLTAGR